MPGNYYSAHLHIHSCVEASASMASHCYEAERAGIDILWITEHDRRYFLKSYQIESFDFPEGKMYTETDRGWLGWKVTSVDEGVSEHTAEITAGGFDDDHALQLKMVSEPECEDWQSYEVTFDADKKGHIRALLKEIRMNMNLFPQKRVDENSRIILEVYLSERPPAHNRGIIRYVLGPDEGLSGENIEVIQLADFQEWKTLELDLARDAEKRLGGYDNSFHGMKVILQARKGEGMEAVIGSLRFPHSNEGEDLRKKQRRLAVPLADEYGIKVLVGTEMSTKGGHRVTLGSGVPFNMYIEDQKAVEWVHKHGGIIALSHYLKTFRDEVDPEMSSEERKNILSKKAENLAAKDCFSADMIEIGFPEGRHDFGLKEHLYFWDLLSKQGILITGTGVSDSHSALKGWREGNNFVNWIGACEPEEEELMAGLKSGNVYMGDPYRFSGELTFVTEKGERMGQVVTEETGPLEVVLGLSRASENWLIRWVINGQSKQEIKACEGAFETREEIFPGEFARAEIYDGDGRCIVLTNPIYYNPDLKYSPSVRQYRS